LPWAPIERGLELLLQRLVVDVEPERLLGSLRVRRSAARDQFQQDAQRAVVPRRRQRQDDRVPDVGPLLAR
jgi:hypothetical protein